ncbi:Octopine-binding periplasmic protein [Paraburkholderia caribensis]|uniref:lysine/arginine/ornithine ABC transporter substrate-binding protein n=1 Tax=Paraburkholderia caribensis TaxID=75105 RepID=UPI001CB4BD3C|nr:lysine/arginine/ornithine ABC transporter substrate-binding protein [Paraburkholderia caribensis]CAG9236727.1 Octopine-binding periplasmic protein [Paraburkholderia caribensis]
MRFPTLPLFLVGVALAQPAFAVTTWDKVTIATEGAYAPWNFMGPNGKLQGYEVDLANELCVRMKAKCDVVAQDWDGIIPALNAGKYDAIMASMGVTPERQKVVAFSVAYTQAPNGFMTLKSSPLAQMPDLNTLFNLSKDEGAARKEVAKLAPLLKGKVLGVQSASTAANFVDKYLKDYVEVREYKTIEQHNLDLEAGRVDLVMANITVLNKAVSQPDMKDATLAGPRFIGGVLGGGTTNVALRKRDTELKEKFDAAIKSVNDDGTNKKLMQKWFGLDLSPQN